jgi:hypothetical protein
MAQQIKKKFIANDAVDGTKLLLENGQAVRTKDATGATVDLIELQDGKVYLKNEEAALKRHVDQVILDYQAADAIVLEEAKLYTDDQIEIERLRAIAAEAAVLAEAKLYTDTEVEIEKTRAMAAEAALSTRIDGKFSSTEKGAANGVAPLDANSKLPAQYLPSISITEVYVVETLAERAALIVQTGDVVKVTKAMLSSDGVTFLSRTYIYNGSEWIDLSAESDVDSINGRVGHVVLNTGDIAEFGDNRYYTPAREQAQKDYTDAAVLVEEQRAMQREDELQGEIDALRSDLTELEERVFELETNPTPPVFKKEKIVVGQQLSFIDLQLKAAVDSLIVCVDRLNLQLSDDYTVSVVNGKTRLTWVNDYAIGAVQGVEADDVIYVTYCVNSRP